METAAFDESQIIAMPLPIATGESVLSPSVAVAACFAMALGYVLVLYVPTFVLRLPPSTSLESFLIRRFICALVFSAVSVLASATLLGVTASPILQRSVFQRTLFSQTFFFSLSQIDIFRDFSSMLSVYGIRKDHMWQAAVYPLFLTSLLYAGSLVSKPMLRVRGGNSCCELGLCNIFAVAARSSLDRALACAHNVAAWRNYVVVSVAIDLHVHS